MRLRMRSLLFLLATSTPISLKPLQPAHFRYFLHKISEMNILQPDLSANPNISKIRAEESSGGATPCTPLAPMF
jgi:hypothetical protein